MAFGVLPQKEQDVAEALADLGAQGFAGVMNGAGIDIVGDERRYFLFARQSQHCRFERLVDLGSSSTARNAAMKDVLSLAEELRPSKSAPSRSYAAVCAASQRLKVSLSVFMRKSWSAIDVRRFSRMGAEKERLSDSTGFWGTLRKRNVLFGTVSSIRGSLSAGGPDLSHEAPNHVRNHLRRAFSHPGIGRHRPRLARPPRRLRAWTLNRFSQTATGGGVR